MLVGLVAFVLPVTPRINVRGQTNSLNDIYRDESHCLIGPEIRSDNDGPISCYCRDDLVNARYVWQTYLAPPKRDSLRGKDENLHGVEVTLQRDAYESCGKEYDIHSAVEAEDWKWKGPEVVRTYPPDDVLRQIKPDSHGMIHYEYTVVLLHRDSSGKVVKTESFAAQDMVPLELLKNVTKPSPPAGAR